MKKIFAFAGMILLSISAFADTKPTEASLDELLTITESQKLVDSMWPQMDGMLKNSAKEALGGAILNDVQQKASDETNKKMEAIFKKEFSFEKVKPILMQGYQASFSQEEVDGMIKFYKSKAGKAVITKMPMVMQSTMGNIEEKMSQITPKLLKIQQDSIADIKAKATAAN